MYLPGNVKKGLHELQIQTSKIQVGADQASTAQTSLALGMSQAAKLVRIVDLRTVALLEGSLSTKLVDDKIIISTLKNIILNNAALPNEFFHVLQIGVIAKLRARELQASTRKRKNLREFNLSSPWRSWSYNSNRSLQLHSKLGNKVKPWSHKEWPHWMPQLLTIRPYSNRKWNWSWLCRKTQTCICSIQRFMSSNDSMMRSGKWWA